MLRIRVAVFRANCKQAILNVIQANQSTFRAHPLPHYLSPFSLDLNLPDSSPSLPLLIDQPIALIHRTIIYVKLINLVKMAAEETYRPFFGLLRFKLASL